MSDDASTPDASLPLAVLEWIDGVCRDFEAAWRPDGRQLASGSFDRTVKVWLVAELLA